MTKCTSNDLTAKKAKKAKYEDQSHARSVLLSRLIAPLVSVHGVYGVALASCVFASRSMCNLAPSNLVHYAYIPRPCYL